MEIPKGHTLRKILPATNWRAIFFCHRDSKKASKPVFFTEPIVCWVITEYSEPGVASFLQAHAMVVDCDGVSDDAQDGCGHFPLKPAHPENEDRGLPIFMGYARGESDLKEAIDAATVKMTAQMRAAKWIQ